MRARFLAPTLAAALSGLAFVAPPARAQAATPTTPSYVPGELLIRFERGVSAAERGDLRRRQGLRFERNVPLPGVQLVQSGTTPVALATRALERAEGVVYAEPNYVYRGSVVPNDPGFPQLWGMSNIGQSVAGKLGTPDADIDAPEAWDLTTGAPGTVVAVIDSGVDLTHPDLAPNAWSNPGEAAGNRVDDDGNGYVDDARGWDFVTSSADTGDRNGHGTHVAGTIAARGNDGVGIAGLNWQASVMALRATNAAGGGTAAQIAAALAYAGREGARVANISLGAPFVSSAIVDAIAGAPNTLFVAAADNGGADGIGDNADSVGDFPCSLPAPNVVCVGASDRDDNLTRFSNFGAATVDLAAPGVDIVSTAPGGFYTVRDGTSFATPHVAGAAALVWSRYPGASVEFVRNALLARVDPKPSLTGRVASGGRLNAASSVTVAPPQPPPAPPAPAALAAGAASTRGLATLIGSGRRALRVLVSRGLRVRVRCARPCTIRVRLVIDRRTARRLGFRLGRRRSVVVAIGAARLRGAGARAVTLRPTAAARRRLSRARRLTPTLETTIRGGGVAAVVDSQRVTLTR